MNRETIEQEINARLDEPDNQWDGIFNSGYSRGFKDGAQWRINAVWNSPEEEPKADECIIVEKELFEGKYSYDCWKIESGCAWDKESDYFCVTRWAYVRDLVPDGKEDGR